MSPKLGREKQFDELSRYVVDYVGPFAAFARCDESGLYGCVHILPAEDATPEKYRRFDTPSA